MAKKVEKNKAVAYCTPPLVEVAGFYIMEGEPSTSVHMSERATETVKAHMSDDPDKTEFDHPTETEEDEEYEVVHETNYEPTTLVYASPDGQGWQYEEPPPDKNSGPSKVVTK